jgi:hypothetical protein
LGELKATPATPEFIHLHPTSPKFTKTCDSHSPLRNDLGKPNSGVILVSKVFGMMYYDYNKRSYLLPPGCKDLIDLLRLEEQKKRSAIQLPTLEGLLGGETFIASTQEILGPWKLKKKKSKEPQPDSLKFPSIHEIAIPDEIPVMELAKIAGQKPFKIVADLMEIGIFANVYQKIGFDAASRVLKKYGILAKKAA